MHDTSVIRLLSAHFVHSITFGGKHTLVTEPRHVIYTEQTWQQAGDGVQHGSPNDAQEIFIITKVFKKKQFAECS